MVKSSTKNDTAQEDESTNPDKVKQVKVIGAKSNLSITIPSSKYSCRIIKVDEIDTATSKFYRYHISSTNDMACDNPVTPPAPTTIGFINHFNLSDELKTPPAPTKVMNEFPSPIETVQPVVLEKEFDKVGPWTDTSVCYQTEAPLAESDDDSYDDSYDKLYGYDEDYDDYEPHPNLLKSWSSEEHGRREPYNGNGKRFCL
jgi:hypothetical protein